MSIKKNRRRGVVLSLIGQQKLAAARRQLEKTANLGDRLTQEELSERTQLSISTIVRVLEAQIGVDKLTLDQFFAAFDLCLERQDYHSPQIESDRSHIPPPDPAEAIESQPQPIVDWGEAIDVSVFYGRDPEISTLTTWITADGCRLVGILGMGGIGKTALSVKLAQQLLGSDAPFEFIIWRTLRNAPPLELLLTDLIQVLSCQRESLPAMPIPALLTRLLHYLRQHRCLLILDNGETILQGGEFTGLYRSDYEAYGELLRQVGEIPHQSCLVLTSREKPETIANLEGEHLLVRSFALNGLLEDDGARLFDAIGLLPAPVGRKKLIEIYSGNPLALKIVATSIRELFDGDVDAFINEDTTIFNGIRRLLDRQYERLTSIERQVMIWLAIEREWVTIAKLQADIVPSAPKQRLMETLESLSRRSLIEQKNGRFTQQPVVMEYMTEQLIDRVCREIQTLNTKIHNDLETLNDEFLAFNSYALIQATARDYVRESQVRLILQPIADWIWRQFRSAAVLDRQMRQILTMVRASEIDASYGAGNLINLMHHLQLDLTGYDFAELAMRQACLQTLPLHRVNLSGAHIIDCQFAETIGTTYSLAISTNIDRLAIGGEDGTIHIWQASTGQPLQTIEAHTSFIFALTFSQDGQTLVSGGTDWSVRFWDVTSGSCLQTRKLDGSIWALALSPDGKLLAGSTSGEYRTLHLWDGITGECLKTFTGHSSQASDLNFIPYALAETGWLLVSGSHDCTLKIWDLDRGDCLRTLTGHSSIVFAVGVRPQGDLIASGSFDCAIKLWNWQTGECVRTLLGHTAEVSSISFSPDGQLLASGSNDLTIRIWDVTTGECLQVLQGHQDQVWKIVFTSSQERDGTQQLILVSIGFDRAIRFWHICTLAPTLPLLEDPPLLPRSPTLDSYCLKTIQGGTMSIRTLDCHPQGGLLASAGVDNQIWLWNEAGACLKVLAARSGIWKVTFNPHDRMLASAGFDGEIKLWDIDTGCCLRSLNDSWVQALSFSPQGDLLSSSSSDATIRFWDTQTGECFRTIALESDAYLLDLAFHPQGHYFVTTGNDDRLRWWDTQSGECLRVVAGNQGGHGWCVAFHPQGHLFATVGHDRSVKLWNADSGECCQILLGHTGILGAVAFSPDGKILASGRSDRTIRLWDVITGECVHVLEGHTSGVTSVCFLPVDPSQPVEAQPQILVSGSHDETIRLWDVRTGECLKMFRPDRLYEGMNITGITGLTEGAIATLKSLGAVGL